MEDAPAIAKLFQRVWPMASEYPTAWRALRVLSVEEIRQEMWEGHFRYFGIRDEGRIIGVYKLSIGKEVLGEHLAVDPSYRKKGLARLMYNQFLRLGRRLGKPNSINLLVTNKELIRFVTSMGFRSHGLPYEQHPGMLVQKFIYYHKKE